MWQTETFVIQIIPPKLLISRRKLTGANESIVTSEPEKSFRIADDGVKLVSLLQTGKMEDG